jgi:hypothetical protein
MSFIPSAGSGFHVWFGTGAAGTCQLYRALPVSVSNGITTYTAFLPYTITVNGSTQTFYNWTITTAGASEDVDEDTYNAKYEVICSAVTSGTISGAITQ